MFIGPSAVGRGPWRTVHGTGLGPSDRALDKLMDVLPHERRKRIVNIVNHEMLARAGLETRFGLDWVDGGLGGADGWA